MTTRTIGRYLLTFDQATRIIRLFKQKKHRGAGYHFELEDAPGKIDLKGVRVSKAAAWGKNNPVLLKVLRDTPDK